jgi:hypothetical protein
MDTLGVTLSPTINWQGDRLLDWGAHERSASPKVLFGLPELRQRLTSPSPRRSVANP